MKKDSYYTVEQFDGYYRIGSAESVFCYLIPGTERAMLIDTGCGIGDLRATVDSLTDLPLVIVNTHGHFDHTGGNGYFDVPCYIHADDVRLAEDHCSTDFRRPNAERMMKSVNYETGEVFNALPDDFDIEEYCSLGTGNLTTAEPGKVFDLGGATMELVWTPGHTKGVPFDTFMDGYRKPRTCAVDGMTLDDMFKPGFAAVVIAPDWH